MEAAEAEAAAAEPARPKLAEPLLNDPATMAAPPDEQPEHEQGVRCRPSRTANPTGPSVFLLASMAAQKADIPTPPSPNQPATKEEEGDGLDLDRSFDGRAVYLNKLEGVAAGAGGAAPPIVARPELIGCKARLQAVPMTSYGTDYSFVDELLRGSPARERTPRERAPRGIVVVDNYDHHTQRQQANGYTTRPEWVG